MHRLNGLLLVTKTCTEDSCRKPWPILRKESGNGTFGSLDEAMDPKYDEFFSSLPQVGFQECLFIQYTPNEIPFFPPQAVDGLGMAYREATDNFPSHESNGTKVPGSGGRMGTTAQRYATLADIMKSARNVTDAEIGSPVTCYPPDYCGSITGEGIRGTSGSA